MKRAKQQARWTEAYTSGLSTWASKSGNSGMLDDSTRGLFSPGVAHFIYCQSQSVSKRIRVFILIQDLTRLLRWEPLYHYHPIRENH
jgi:hypothetical protein